MKPRIEKGYFRNSPRYGRTTKLMVNGACVLEVMGVVTLRAMLRQWRGEETIQMAKAEPWFVVQNGAQIDVHARVFPSNQQAREVTVYSDLSDQDARRVCETHNPEVERKRKVLAEDTFARIEGSIAARDAHARKFGE